MRDKTIQELEKDIAERLNSGIIRSDENGILSIAYPHEKRADNIRELEMVSQILDNLERELEDKGVDCNDRLPDRSNADANGNVQWLRSGVWMHGPALGDRPVDATRWREIPS